MRKTSARVPMFGDYSNLLIDRLQKEGRFGTARTYVRARTSFLNFTGDIGLKSISHEVINGYNRYLMSRGVLRNTLSFYNRVLRAIYNKGVHEYRFPDTHPFVEVYTGIDRTGSRAVSEVSIAKLATLSLPESRKRESLDLARDLFLFSYAMRGMPFVDMAYLKKSQIRDGYLTYTRHKTGRTLRIRIETDAKRIIDKYREKSGASEYLFPILDGGKSCTCNKDRYLRYCSRLAAYNCSLRLLSTMLGRGVHLSSYVPRHSWATAARNSGIGVAVISEALGHSSERMTRIYMGSLNSTIIDETNRKLLSRLHCRGNRGNKKSAGKARALKKIVSTK